MFKVIRSNRLKIEMWQIFDLYNERRHLKRRTIAKLMLSFTRCRLLNLMVIRRRLLRYSNFCACVAHIWSKQPERQARCCERLSSCNASRLPPFLVASAAQIDDYSRD